MTRLSSLAPLLLLSLAYGCGTDDQAVESSDAGASVGDGGGSMPRDAALSGTSDAGELCRTFVSDSLIQHACFHELMGPYAERTVATNAGELGIELNRAHTSFRVRLLPSPQGGFRGLLTYQARIAGAYAIFARDAIVQVTAQGMPLAPTFAHDTQICAPLPLVSAYGLGAQTYTLQITSAQPDVVLVIEYMDEGTVTDAYRIDCTTGPRTLRDAAVFTLDAAFASDAAAVPRDGRVPDIDDGAVAPWSDADAAAPNDGSVAAPFDASPAPENDAAARSNDGGMCLVDPVLEHSCLHALHGPFEAVSAVDTAAASPDISRPHTAWRMALPAAASGRFVFRPNMEGEYAFYLDRALPLHVSSGGTAVGPTFLEPVTSCAGISDVQVFPLTRGTRYDVVVGPVTGDATTLIIESVQAFTSTWSGRLEPCL